MLSIQIYNTSIQTRTRLQHDYFALLVLKTWHSAPALNFSPLSGADMMCSHVFLGVRWPSGILEEHRCQDHLTFYKTTYQEDQGQARRSSFFKVLLPFCLQEPCLSSALECGGCSDFCYVPRKLSEGQHCFYFP